MCSDIVKRGPTDIDGFAGWEDGVEGDDQPQSAGVIQGSLDKFTNEQTWETRDGEAIDTTVERVAVDVMRVVQKWRDHQPVETTILEAHQKFPDIEKMNAETPHEEWVEGRDGKPCGPWQGQHILYSVDPKTMDKYTYPTSTTGGRIAIRELRDKVIWMRRLRGPNVYPVIKLSRIWMNTRFGGRYRPHFEILRWVRLGGQGGEVEAISPPTPPTSAAEQLDQFAKPVERTTAQSDLPLTTVAEPSLKEDLNDEVPDFGAKPETANEPKKAPALRPTARRDLKKQPSAAKTAARSPSRKRLTNMDAG